MVTDVCKNESNINAGLSNLIIVKSNEFCFHNERNKESETENSKILKVDRLPF